MNDNQDMNQTNESVDLEKTQVINSEDINTNVEEPKVEETVQEPVVEPTTEEPVKEDVSPTVVDQTVIQNISSSTNNDNVEIKNIVDNSSAQVPTEESKPVEPEKVYKDPSKLSTVLVIILFVGLFVFLFEMPKITEWIENKKQDSELDLIERQAKAVEEANKKKEEEKKKAAEEAKKKEEELEASMKTLTCTLIVPASETTTYFQETTQLFHYNGKDKVLASSQTTVYKFTVQDQYYLDLKSLCEANSTKYIGKEGYTYSCGSDDLSVTIGNEFDLATYKTIQDGATTINANATLNEDINTVKTRLTAAGYICQ